MRIDDVTHRAGGAPRAADRAADGPTAIDVLAIDVLAARTRLRGLVRETPLQPSALPIGTHSDVLLKLECWQRTGSFKLRGALNAVLSLSDAERSRGLVTASAGNHGQAVALAAQQTGAGAVVFVPHDAPAVKQERIRAFGAELRTDAADYDDAERLAEAYAGETGGIFVHAFSDPAVIAGQGTLGLELLDVCSDFTEILVPVGGGGLITGIGVLLKTALPDVRVIGVQSTETRAMYEAFRAGRAVDVPIPPTLADGLAGCTDEATYRRARDVVDEMVLVTEPELENAIRLLFRHDGVVAEGAGAVTAAALLSGRVRLRGRCVAVISGGNIDGRRLAGILGRTE
jgi:threonine dehydratase